MWISSCTELDWKETSRLGKKKNKTNLISKLCFKAAGSVGVLVVSGEVDYSHIQWVGHTTWLAPVIVTPATRLVP